MNFKEAYEDACSTVGAMARCGDLLGLQNLVWNDRPVDVKDNRGWRPTHEAASNDHPGCLEFLLRQEATDPNWDTFEKETAMLLAARNGHTGCVRLLLNFNADPNLCTNEGFSPLWEALVARSRDCIRLLVKRGADVNCKIYTDYTPLHLAAEKGNANIVAYFLNHGARLDVFTEHHLSPIFLAAHSGQLDTLKVLLKVATDRDQPLLVNETAKDNASPLLIAAQEGHTECVEVLLDCGADPNIQVVDTKAVALQYAIYKNHFSCIQLLLPVTELTKADNCSDVQMHPLLLALKLKDTKILQLLIKAGFKVNVSLPLDPEEHPLLMNLMSESNQTLRGSLLCHVEEDWPEQGTRLLLEAGLTPNKLSEHDVPPLVAMLCGENLKFYKLLLQFGANPNIYHKKVLGNLAMIAALRNDLTVKDECRNGGDVLPQNRYVWPLLLAGGEAVSLFTSRTDKNGLQTPKISIQNLIDEFHTSKCFTVFSSLMCFCQFLDIPSDLMEQFTEKQRKHLSKISASTYTLAHICRKKIVLELARQKNYSKKKLESLEATIPVSVQEYLLFSEFEFVTQSILQINNASIQ